MTLIVVVNGIPRSVLPSRALQANWPDTPKQKAFERTEAVEMPMGIKPVDMFGTDLPASWPEPPSTTMQSTDEPRRTVRMIGLDSLEQGGDIFRL